MQKTVMPWINSLKLFLNFFWFSFENGSKKKLKNVFKLFLGKYINNYLFCLDCMYNKVAISIYKKNNITLEKIKLISGKFSK